MQQLALPQRVLGAAAPCSRRQAAQRNVKRVVLARADPESRVVREYREDDDSMVVPGAAKKDDGSIYVDDQRVRAAAAARKDNMSKEMKARLRKEYVGFGGAENQAMSGNYFVWISLIVAVLAVMSKLIGAI